MLMRQLKLLMNQECIIVGPLETTVQGEMSECLILIQKLNERMVELECPSIISQVKFYHVPEGIDIETLTGKYDEE